MQANASIAMWKTGVEEFACKALAILLFPALVVPCRTMAVGDIAAASTQYAEIHPCLSNIAAVSPTWLAKNPSKAACIQACNRRTVGTNSHNNSENKQHGSSQVNFSVGSAM
jgi:hypothetical protein